MVRADQGEGLVLHAGEFAQRLVERLALLFQLDDPFAAARRECAHLFEMLGIGVVEVDELLDVLERESEPLAAQDQLHAGDLAAATS